MDKQIEVPLFVIRLKVGFTSESESAHFEFELRPAGGVGLRPAKAAPKPPEDDFDPTVGDLIVKPENPREEPGVDA